MQFTIINSKLVASSLVNSSAGQWSGSWDDAGARLNWAMFWTSTSLRRLCLSPSPLPFSFFGPPRPQFLQLSPFPHLRQRLLLLSAASSPQLCESFNLIFVLEHVSDVNKPPAFPPSSSSSCLPSSSPAPGPMAQGQGEILLLLLFLFPPPGPCA